MDLLWKKESKPNGETCFVDLLKNAKSNKFVKQTDKEFQNFVQRSHLPGNEKCDRIALVMRNTGNDKFKEKRWTEAMNFYNQSLCYAEPDSQMVGIAYANRSACFYHMRMYEKCLIDIDLAVSSNYPDDLLEKLEKRKINCLKAIDSLDNVSHAFSNPTLSFRGDRTFPEMANVLEIKYNRMYGRHIVAKDDIDVGKIVLIEKPYSCGASVSSKIEQCITCFAVNQNFIPCERCVSAMFCANDCKERNNIHWMECNDTLPVLRGHSRHVYNLVLKTIILFPNASRMMAFVHKTLSSKPKEHFESTENEFVKYRSFLTLNITRLMDKDKEFIPILYKAYTKLSSLTTIKKMFETKQEKRFLLHLTAHHYLVLMSNVVDLWRIKKKALFIIQSYFNYACAPNLLYFPHNGHSVCFTIRPIKKGDQLFVSYFGDFNEQAEVCHNLLWTHFGFDCNCERCVPNCDDESLVNAIMSDQQVAFLYDAFEQKWKSPENVKVLINTCVKLLQKFGSMPWNIATEQIARWLLHCLYLNLN